MLSPAQTDAFVALIDGAATVEAATTALKTCATVVGNCADPAKRVLKCGNAGLQKKVLGMVGGEAFLISLGFVADESAGTLTWDASLAPEAAQERAAAVSAALSAFEAIASALAQVGDANAPAQAREAVKLAATVVGNIAAEPDASAKRRLGATSKALNNRLLSARGGPALLLACGFCAEPPTGEPEAYICASELPTVRVVFATLEKAPAIWAGLAAARSASGDGDGDGGGGGGGGPKVTPDEPSVAVDGILIKSLPSRATLLTRTETRDMQPALCKSDNGFHVELHTWQCASKRWSLQGSIEIPGGDFVWAVGNACILIEVDLGDAHGTGSAAPMRVPVADGNVNEYVTARDFIAEHEADSYARHKEPVLNNNWLEEIARKVRAASEPVLLTVQRLKAAMLDQH